MRETTKSATDVLIEAMEHAEEMQECVVVYRLKDQGNGEDGFSWLSNVKDNFTRVGMMHTAAHGMDEIAYKQEEQDG